MEEQLHNMHTTSGNVIVRNVNQTWRAITVIGSVIVYHAMCDHGTHKRNCRKCKKPKLNETTSEQSGNVKTQLFINVDYFSETIGGWISPRQYHE